MSSGYSILEVDDILLQCCQAGFHTSTENPRIVLQCCQEGFHTEVLEIMSSPFVFTSSSQMTTGMHLGDAFGIASKL